MTGITRSLIMRAGRIVAGCAAVCLVVMGAPANAQGDMPGDVAGEGQGQAAEQPQTRADIVAVVSPMVRLRGRVLQKDGVTPVYNAAMVLSSKLDGSEHRVVSDTDGMFEIKLPVGQYTLRISRWKEIYESPSVYSIPAVKRLDVDFLLLRHFEPEAAPDKEGEQNEAIAERYLPGPKTQPEVVGTIIDVVKQSTAAGGKRRRWGEVLGFVGGLLLVGIAAS